MDNLNRFGVDFAIMSFVNGFNKDERAGVRLACETHKENIQDEVKGKPTYTDTYRTENLGFYRG